MKHMHVASLLAAAVVTATVLTACGGSAGSSRSSTAPSQQQTSAQPATTGGSGGSSTPTGAEVAAVVSADGASILSVAAALSASGCDPVGQASPPADCITALGTALDGARTLSTDLQARFGSPTLVQQSSSQTEVMLATTETTADQGLQYASSPPASCTTSPSYACAGIYQASRLKVLELIDLIPQWQTYRTSSGQ